MTGNPPSFGQRLREAREAANLSQRRLAIRLGLSNTSIGNWEKDANLPELHQLPYLADALGMDEGDLARWIRFSPRYLHRDDPMGG